MRQGPVGQPIQRLLRIGQVSHGSLHLPLRRGSKPATGDSFASRPRLYLDAPAVESATILAACVKLPAGVPLKPTLARFGLDRCCWAFVVIAAAAYVALTMYLTRGATLFVDETTLFINDRGGLEGSTR